MSKKFYRNAATISALAVPITMVLNVVSSEGTQLETVAKRMIAHGISLFSLGLSLFGILAGIVAFFGIPRYGSRGIRNKALIGVAIPLVFIAVTLPMLIEDLAEMKKMRHSAQSLDGAVDDINRRTPFVLGERVRVDHVSLEPGQILVFEITLLNAKAEDFSPGALQANFADDYRENYRTNPALQTFRDEKVTLLYRFRDLDGKAIGEITLPSPQTKRT